MSLISLDKILSDYPIIEFVKNLSKVYEFSTLMVSGGMSGIFSTLNFPLLIMDLEKNASFKLIDTPINQFILNILFLKNETYKFQLENLSEFLTYNKESKVILIGELEIFDILKICWKIFILNAIVFQKSSEKLFAYKNYPDFKVYESSSDYFPEKILNCQGHMVSYGFIQETPRKFKYYYKNKRLNGGYAWHILEEFAKAINLTLYEKYDYDNLNKNVLQIIDLQANGSIEFSPIFDFQKIENQSYFVERFTSLQIAPVIFNLNKMWYLVEPFTLESWFILVFMITFFTILLSTVNRILYNNCNFYKYYFISVKLLFFQQPINSKIVKPKLRSFFALLLFFGFISVSTYNALLGSFLTKSRPRQQINTFQDLKEQKIKFMASFEELNLMKTGKIESYIPEKYMSLVKAVPFAIAAKHRDYLNTSFAYNMHSDKWMFLKRTQKIRNKFIFRVMDDSSTRTYRPVSFPFGRHSIFRSAFDRFLIRVYSMGLVKKWKNDVVFELSKGGLLYKIDRIEDPKAKPLSIEYYILPLYILGTGFFISSFFYCGEWIFYRLIL